MIENLGFAIVLAALLAGLQALVRSTPPLAPVPVRTRDPEPPRR